MRKVYALILGLGFALMVGCGSGDKSPTGPGGEKIETVTTTHSNGNTQFEFDFYRPSNNEIVQHGINKTYYENGNIQQEGEYVNGKREGVWSFYDKNGVKTHEGTFQDGKPWNGTFTVVSEVELETSTGFYEYIYKNLDYSDADLPVQKSVKSTVIVSSYTAGVLNGKWVEYDNIDDMNIILEDTIVDGVLSGPHTLYHNNGNKMEEGVWESGNPEGVWIHYFENGKKKFEAGFRAGVLDGVWKTYYNNGNIANDTNIKDFRFIGNYKRYYRDGMLQVEGVYLADKVRDGEWSWYDENGGIIYTEVWSGGVIEYSPLIGEWWNIIERTPTTSSSGGFGGGVGGRAGPTPAQLRAYSQTSSSVHRGSAASAADPSIGGSAASAADPSIECIKSVILLFPQYNSDGSLTYSFHNGEESSTTQRISYETNPYKIYSNEASSWYIGDRVVTYESELGVIITQNITTDCGGESQSLQVQYFIPFISSQQMVRVLMDEKPQCLYNSYNEEVSDIETFTRLQ